MPLVQDLAGQGHGRRLARVGEALGDDGVGQGAGPAVAGIGGVYAFGVSGGQLVGAAGQVDAEPSWAIMISGGRRRANTGDWWKP